MLFDLGYVAHQANFSRPGYQGTSLQQFIAMFPSEGACLEHVFRTRYQLADLCPRCGESARWSPVVDRRMVRHRRCNRVVFPYSGTLLDQSRIPAQLWFYMMLHLANSHESVNGYFVQRHLGISLKAAQRMLKRVRLHLAALDQDGLASGHGETVEVRLERLRGAWNPTRPSYNRTNVLFIARGALIDFVVVNLYKPHRLRGILECKLPGTYRIVTNCERTARLISNYRPSTSSAAFVPPGDSSGGVDTILSFLHYFRRGWRLQHQNVHASQLWLYLSEYRFRYNRRSRSRETFRDMVSSFPSIDPLVASQLRQAYSDLS